MPLDTAGRQPLAPDTPDALTDIVRAAAADGTPLDLMGSGTRRALGRPVTANARTVSLRGLSGVREYSPTELYITVGAGTPVAEVTAALAEKGQGLLFEPPDLCALLGSTGQPTIGGAVATGFAGPARIAGGGIRDSLIGVELVTGRAEAIRSGGKVMKNVTGYDLTKLMIGAFGTLGALTEVTFKVLPTPRRTATLAVRGLADAQARELMSLALASPYEVTGAAHLPAGLAARCGVAQLADGASTLLRLGGFAESIDYRVGELTDHLDTSAQIDVLDDAASATVWTGVRDVRPLAGAESRAPDRAVWRISVKPTDGPEVVARLADLAPDALYDWGGGLVWLAVDAGSDAAAPAVRAAAGAAGGTAMLVRAPDGVRATVPFQAPPAGALAAVVARLREAFDPAGVLNPGRLYPET
ncbi:MAG: glycolate oxidase subunit GlcE [Rhodospirillaceae bacterium]|nr:glycolate oxidase subunit GlcE [Rhodospirillaceae bacterium]